MAGLQASFLKRTGIINAILMAAVLGIACWLAAWALLGDSVAYLGFINAGGLMYGFAALVAGLVLLIRRRWIIGILGLAFAIFLLAYPSGTNIAAGEDRLLPSDIRIMSASLRGLNQDMAGTATHLAQYDADIIGLQEVYNPAIFKAALEEATGTKWYMAVQAQNVGLSKFPLVSSEETLHGMIKFRIVLPKGEALNIWSMRAPKYFAEPQRNLLFYSALASQIDAENPDLVIGDFNATPWNKGYAIVSKKMQNAHKVAGLGAGSTFPGPARRSGIFGAYARIDHIFADNKITITNAFTGTSYVASDHHPVVADIRIP